MTKPRHAIVLALTFAFAATLQGQGIVDAHLNAVGGMQAIAKIKTIHRSGALSGTSTSGPLTGVFEEVYDLRRGAGYTSMEMTGYSRKSGWIGESGWTSDSQSGVTKTPADEVAMSRLSAGASPLANIRAVYGAGVLKEEGKTTFNGKQCAIVTSAGSPIQFYVNLESKLLEGMSIPNLFTATSENYKAVNGVQFAGKSTIRLDTQALTVVYDYKSTKINGDVDASLFKNPSDGTAPASAPTAKNSPRVTPKQIVASMDTNGDGKISKQEASEDLKLVFGDVDTDNDGKIDIKEAQVVADYVNKEQAGKAKPAPAAGRITAKQVVDSMDKNKDGKISKDEASSELKPYFDQHDSDGDGVISVKEAQVIADYVNRLQGK